MKRKFPLMLLLIAITAAAQTTPTLKIGPGDLLSIDVFDVPELKQEVRVTEAGDAELSLSGKLHLAGLTPHAAAAVVSHDLQSRGFVVHPQVSITIREYATQGVAVLGEVRKPGIYQLFSPRSVTQLLSEAGGLTEVASPKLTIHRANSTDETVLLPRNSSSGVLLYPGDSVLVQRAGVAYIVGDVARSGGYVLQDDGALSIAQLVTLGGGLTPTARANKARLIRRTTDGCQELIVNVAEILRGRSPDLHLQHDDILFIPNSAWKSAATRLQNITQLTIGAAIYSSLN